MPCYTYYDLAILTMTLKVSPSSPLHAHSEKSFSAAASNLPSCRGTWLGEGLGLEAHHPPALQPPQRPSHILLGDHAVAVLVPLSEEVDDTHLVSRSRCSHGRWHAPGE
eukprot:scaffold22698_cov39-Phaeocystis_antarctica.AAC.2